MIRSIRVRLTLWYVLLLAVILALFSVSIYFALREALYSNLDDSLQSRADLATSLATNGGMLKGPSDIDIPGDPFEKEHFTRIYDANGNLIFSNLPEGFDLPINPAAVDRALEAARCDDCGSFSTYRHEGTGQGMRILTRPVLSNNGAPIGAVEVGLSEGDQRDALRLLLIIIAIAYPLTLIVTSAGGVFLASRALGPIDRMTQVARRISAEDLSRRLDMKLADDEVGRLARTFNDMIARLDEAFRRQRQFTADASHELRTPLTAIKGQAEVALQREREPAEYRKVLANVNAQVDRMIRLVGSLLTLARADAGQMAITREEVDLGQLISDAAEQLAAAAREKRVELRVHAGPSIRLLADEDLLLQLALNLLDNAVKYTPSGGSVGVRWAVEDGAAVVRISDTGPGIPPEHLPHVFDRFYRADSSRSVNAGAGLGLSISKWIAQAHGGTIAAESAPGHGSTLTVRIPLDVPTSS